MDTNRKKRASEWFYQTLYRDEQIQPRSQSKFETVPEEIRAMRALESGVEMWRQSREAIFVKQARLMENFEDDYSYHRDVVRYFPTYQSLTDRELRGYFTWRSRWRRGEQEKTSLSYAFLYIYELLNQIGVSDPIDGYEKLRAFSRDYGALDDGICSYLKRWLWDYVVYYRLDPVLLQDREELSFDRALSVFFKPDNHSDAELFEAVLALSSYRLDRSKLFSLEPALLETVSARVMRKMSAYYAAHRKQTLTEDYFGPIIVCPAELFQGAVFYAQVRREEFSYSVDPLRTYQCRNGKWMVRQPDTGLGRSKKLGDLMRTVDSMLREALGVGNQIQPGLSTKWILKLIEEEIRRIQQEKREQEARRISIDLSKLSGIRRDALVTQKKLIVEEEQEEPEEETEPLPETENSAEESKDNILESSERRLLHALLYGESLSWLQEEGLMSSVLVDSINEKLFDRFGDTVLLDDLCPEVIEDYAEELKEMVKP